MSVAKRLIEKELEQSEGPNTIWLQPWCEDCEKSSYSPENGRLWCQDDVWGKCEDCDRKSVRYAKDD